MLLTGTKKEGDMKLLEEAVMPNNTGRSFKVMKGQRMRIYAESIVDCVPFNLDDLKERFDQARTKAHSGKVFVSTGDKLYSKSARGRQLRRETRSSPRPLPFSTSRKGKTSPAMAAGKTFRKV
jgi:uncharacterized protein YcgI (DUF1989 family)